MYYDTLDPFVALSAAAAVTSKIKLATGICLVVQRDPIHTAKQVASIDRISNGVSCSASAAAGTKRR
jgi:alkanesulfonate monooxygenase SsuD/methylene tetrahydromethanopterin reductase-like flavin-dependent oxidoreductase (luciferase family)